MKLQAIFLGMLVAINVLFTGCSSSNEPVMMSTLKATDYTMSCETLSSEIKKHEQLYKEQKDGGFLETITFGMMGTEEEVEIMIRERIKNLELIYAMKQLKGECKESNAEENRLILNFTEKKSSD